MISLIDFKREKFEGSTALPVVALLVSVIGDDAKGRLVEVDWNE